MGERLGVTVRAHVPLDYPVLCALWTVVVEPHALGLSAADEEEGAVAFLEVNPGLSLGLWQERELIGSDGRRGYIYHLVVLPECRRRGFGRMLVERALSELSSQRIQKVHAFVHAANADGRLFWEKTGFVRRIELAVYSRQLAREDSV